MSDTAFTIEIPPAAVADLKRRLRGTRWPSLAAQPEAPYGVNTAWLQDFCAYWATEFDWYAVQDRLNKGEQHLVAIGNIRVHAQVWRSAEPDAVPLLVTHGWPSTFDEMRHLAYRLTTKDPDTAAVFHVVAPSLPGFGFSPEPAAPHGPVEIAQLWCALMTELGFERFAAHGGDFGAAVTAAVGAIAPERVLGMHLTAATGMRPDRALTPDEEAWLRDTTTWRDRDWGYLHLQRTRPDTASVALSDSPAGLAGWILDRWWSWTDRAPGQDLDDVIDRGDLAALVSIYWFTASIGSSMRMYRHVFGSDDPPPAFAPTDFRLDVPTHIAAFREPVVPPATLLRRHFDLRRYTTMDRGGHFPALEATADLARDLRSAFANAQDRA